MAMTTRTISTARRRFRPTTPQRTPSGTTEALDDVAGREAPLRRAELLGLLTAVTRARTVVEFGTSTGESTLAMARSLSDDGIIHTFETSSEWADAADRAWRAAGVADRIRQHIGAAARLFAAWPVRSPVDLAIVTEAGYAECRDCLVPKMSAGGLILSDGVLYAAETVRPHAPRGTREFGALASVDESLEAVLLALSQGAPVVHDVLAAGPGD